MKLLVVFLSTLALVLGQGGEDKVYAVELGDLEEVGDVDPQKVYAEESPVIRVFDPAEVKDDSPAQESVYAVDNQPIGELQLQSRFYYHKITIKSVESFDVS